MTIYALLSVHTKNVFFLNRINDVILHKQAEFNENGFLIESDNTKSEKQMNETKK